jgi:hypothetical protein
MLAGIKPDFRIKSYEKVGFKIIGKRREALKRGNETHDIVFMDILDKEFYENNRVASKNQPGL